MDSKSDFTSKMLTLEVLVKIYLGSLASCLNGLKSPRNALITKAVNFQVILFVLLVVSPLLVAYRISSFWIKEKFYTEQPYVT